MEGEPSFRLVMRRGPQPDRVFPIEQDVITLGRDPGNDLVIADPEVSRQHARLVRQAGGTYAVEDLGSTNGTYVNGVRLTEPRLLGDGDLLGLGETVTLVFQGTAPELGRTLVGMPSVQPPAGPPTPPVEVRVPQPPPRAVRQPPPAPPAPVYEVPAEEPPPASNTRNLLIACGCLVVLCILCAVIAYIGDAYFPELFYAPLRAVLHALGVGGF